MTELGYYGFPKAHLEDLLVAVKNPSNLIFGPKDVDLSYKNYLAPIVNYLEKKGNKILYIYGEYDTWSACAVNPNPKTDALKMVKARGDHRTRIHSFSKAEKEKIYAQLKKWLKKVDVIPLEE